MKTRQRGSKEERILDIALLLRLQWHLPSLHAAHAAHAGTQAQPRRCRHAGTGTQAQHAGTARRHRYAAITPSHASHAATHADPHPFTQGTQRSQSSHASHAVLVQPSRKPRRHASTSSRKPRSPHAYKQGHHMDLQCYMYVSLLCSLSPSYCSCMHTYALCSLFSLYIISYMKSTFFSPYPAIMVT